MSKNNMTRRGFVLKSAVGVGGLAVSRYSTSAAVIENKIKKAQTEDDEALQSKNFIPDEGDVIIENDEVKLVIGLNAVAKSLLCKSTGEECLVRGKSIPISTITQERPYQNEVKLAYPCQQKTFAANSIRKEGDKLIIGYELIPYKAAVGINIKPHYIEFKLEDFIVQQEGYGIDIKEPPVWQIWFLQLPVRKRSFYGDWLQVVWDDKVATNMLATDPYAHIEAENSDGYYILKAGAERAVKLKGVTAALITCATGKLLDTIGQVEDDYNLPHGVKSRRSQEYKFSYYWSSDINPGNVDQHLRYAKMGGFRAMLIYYTAFLNSKGYRNLGNYEWSQAKYPNGKEDLRKLLNKVDNAGIISGFHFLHSHIGLDSKYVTPIPDYRLNLVQTFTLASPLGKDDTTVHVDQDPSNIEMADRRRVLRIGTELISYDSYTNARPFRITGCKRGALGTQADKHPAGYMFGVLDVSEFGAQSAYINQDNDLQDEIAEKLEDIYDAGFKFCYYDGSEGVNPPFWFNVARAQWRVHKRLKPQPLFAEGAAKTHFSWHILSRGNAFDIFKPEALKESIRKHPAAEAPRMKENFTHINFGWLGYWVPSESTIGTQPDMLEYVTSRAAAWDCPIGIQTNLKKFDDHPRTKDNLEVLRRWEDVRVNDWLTKEQKLSLQNLEQEHILLVNEKNEFELQPYHQIMNVANNSKEIRAFIFERGNTLYVVYWHISGTKKLALLLNHKNVSVVENLQKSSPVAFSKHDGHITIPVSDRRYIKTTGITKDQMIMAFLNASIT
jgi:hypothetical protein